MSTPMDVDDDERGMRDDDDDGDDDESDEGVDRERERTRAEGALASGVSRLGIGLGLGSGPGHARSGQAMSLSLATRTLRPPLSSSASSPAGAGSAEGRSGGSIVYPSLPPISTSTSPARNYGQPCNTPTSRTPSSSFSWSSLAFTAFLEACATALLFTSSSRCHTAASRARSDRS